MRKLISAFTYTTAKFAALSLLLLAACLSACNLRPPSPAGPTLTPTQPRRTLTPSRTPTITPTLTPMAISAANAAYLEPIASLGRGSANAVAWSPDDATLAVGTSFGIDLYDAETYELIGFLDAGRPVSILAFSPDGKRLAAGLEGDIQLWEPANGQLQWTLIKDDETINTLVFRPDGARLFSGGDGNTVNAWDMTDGQLLDTFTGSKSGIRALAVSGDGKWLLAATEKTFSVYDLASGELLYPAVATDTEGVFSATAVFFDRDGLHFIMAGYEMNDLMNMGSRNEPQTAIYEWDISTGKLVKRQLATRNGVYAASASPDRQWLLLGGEDGIHVWDAFTGKASLALKDQLGNTSALAFSPNGLQFAAIQNGTKDGGGILSLWSFASQKIIHRFDEYTSFVADTAFSPDGHWAVVAGENNQVQVWDVANGQVIQHFEGSAPLALSPDGKIIAINEGSTQYIELRLRSVETTEILPKGMLSCAGKVTAVFSSDSQRIIYAGGSCPFTIREIETGKVLTKIDDASITAEYGYTSLALSADEQWVAIGDGYESEVWNLPHKTRLLSLEGIGESLALSADGRLLAASTSGTIEVWDVAAQQQLFQFNTLLSQINSLTFSPDGQVLAVGGTPAKDESANIELWDTWAGEPLSRLEARGGAVVRVQFSDDGKRLFSASQWNIIQVWNTVHAPVPVAALRPTPTYLPTATPTATLAPESSGMVTQIGELGKGMVSPVYRSPDGKIIAYVQGDTLFLTDSNTFDTVSTIEINGFWSTGSSILFSPNGKLLAVSMAYTTAIVDIAKQAVVDYLNDAYVSAFSPDSRWLAYQQGYDPGSSNIRLWSSEPKTWAEDAFTYLSSSPSRRISGFRLSPDGRLVAAGGTSDGAIYIWNTSNGKRRFVLEGHADTVNHVAFSPDGHYLASGSEDGTMRLWDVQTGKFARLINGFVDGVNGVEFSADGSQLHISIYDQPDQVWDMAAEQLRPYQTPPTAPDPFAILLHQQGYIETHSYTQAQFSPDGSMLAVADGNILLWDVASQTVRQTLENPYQNAIYSLAFNADTARITALDDDANLLTWNTHNGELIFSQAIQTSLYPSAFSEDARFWVSQTGDDQVVIWDTANGKPLQELSIARAWGASISALSFSAENTRLYVIVDSVAQVWDWQSGVLLNQFNLTEHPQCYVRKIHRHYLVRACGNYGSRTHELWNLETQDNLELDDYDQGFYFSPDGQLLVGFDYGRLSLLDTQTGQRLYTLEESLYAYDTAAQVSISPDNSTLAIGRGGQAQLWDIRAIASQLDQYASKPLTQLRTVSWPSPTPGPATSAPTNTAVPITITETARFGGGTLDDVIWSADGQQIITAGSMGITRYTADLTETANIESDAWVSSIASLADGRILVAGVRDEHVVVWDTANGQILADLPCLANSPVALSPDGAALLYTNPDDDQLTYHLSTRQTLATFNNSGDHQPAFSADGRLVALAQSYGSNPYPDYLRVWDVQKGVIVNALGGPDNPITDFSFSTDGQYLVGAAGDSAWVWAMQPDIQPTRLSLYQAQSQDYNITIYTQTVTSVAISHDNALLAVGDSEKNIWLYRRDGLRWLRQLSSHTNAIRHLRFSPDGTRLLSSDEDGALMLWDVASGALLAANEDHTGALGGLTFRSDGNLAAWQNSAAWTIHPPDGALLHTTHIYTGTILAASPAGDWLAVYYPYQISLLDAESGELGRMLPEEAKLEYAHTWPVERKFYGAIFSADGQRLATYASGGQWVYDLTNDSEVIFNASAINPSSAAFSSDGQWLVTDIAPGNYFPIVYDLTTGENAWEPSSYDYSALAFSPDQCWLGALARPGTYSYYESQPPYTFDLWDTTTHELDHSIPFTDTAGLTSLAFNPATTLAAVGHVDGKIALVDLSTFEIVTTFEAHRGGVEHLAFSPDGLYLVSSGRDGTIRFWKLEKK